MVPMRATYRLEAFHEPERGAPAPPGPASQENVNRAGLEPRAPIPRFMVPMHAQERKEALHEPPHPRPLPGGEQAFGRDLSVRLLGGDRGEFMVPGHARK